MPSPCRRRPRPTSGLARWLRCALLLCLVLLPGLLGPPAGGEGLAALQPDPLPVETASPVVRNDAPALPPLTLTLQELWRVGGDDGELMLGAVEDVACDADGNVYLLDSQLSHVEVIAPDGRHLRTLSREGEGPGEVRSPRDLVCLPDGTIGIMTMFPARIVRLSREGEPRGSITARTGEVEKGGFVAGALCDARGGNLILGATRLVQTQTGQDRVMYLAGIDSSGREIARYREAHMTLDFGALKFVEREVSPTFHSAVALGPDGKVYVARQWDEYAVEVYRPDGALERVVTRAFQNRRRDETELRRVNAVFEASARNSPYRQEQEIEPCPPAISGLHVDADGRLWVLHSRGDRDQPAGVMLGYDLFDPAGRYLREVRIACDGDPSLDGLIWLDDGRVLLVKGLVLAGLAQTDLGSVALGEEAEASNMEIICCRAVGPRD